MKSAILKPKEERRLLRGHHWAYRNEFQRLPELADGELVDVIAANNRFVGRGFFQAAGGIAVRLLARERVTPDMEFFTTRVQHARHLRERLYPDSHVYRWVYGESDGLPGLIADRYGPVVVVQSSCWFYKEHQSGLAEVFLSEPEVRGVHLAIQDTLHTAGEVPVPVSCDLNGLRLNVDFTAGQKTGLFLDQRENWELLRPFARDAAVLDAHCYTGLWSLHAALYGARRVLGVDTSRGSIAHAEEQAAQNGCQDRCAFECADVQEVLKRDQRYGVVLLDPPALAKSRAQLPKALGHYQALNRDAMKALEPGGILITSSCSHFVDPPTFLETLKRAANSAQREARVLAVRDAAADHPVLLSMPETAYLKCVAVQVA